MEWITGVGSNEVDIGFVPQMQVSSSSSSVPWPWPDNMPSPPQEYFDDSNIVWDEEIPMSEATREIEKTMYPFKQVMCNKCVEYIYYNWGNWS